MRKYFPIIAYMTAGILLMTAIMEGIRGDWLKVLATSIYTFIILSMVPILEQNRKLKEALAELTQIMIGIVECMKEDAEHNLEKAKPEPPTFEESQGEVKQ